MSPYAGKALTSTVTADGQLVVALADIDAGEPAADEVVIEVEAAPVNPSDLGGIFGAADPASGDYSHGDIRIALPEAMQRVFASRVGLPIRAGLEGAGRVVAAGEHPAAQALLGKRVAGSGEGFYGQYTRAKAFACLPLPDGLPAEAAAGSFVNPMTALAFLETMRAEGFTGMVHTAAASNLGQMLVRLCTAEGVPLVNIVRSPAQVALLRGLGAEHVVDSSQPGFMGDLIAAIAATQAFCGFDAIGGGKMAGQILTAMEAVASKSGAWSRYGSEGRKHVYIYGALDMGPTVLARSIGFVWDVSGWLLMPVMKKLGMEVAARIRARVAAELTTTFASHFNTKITPAEFLTREHALACNAKTTGNKYLILPNG